MAELITAHFGSAHITPKHDASIRRAIFGDESFVCNYLDKFQPLKPSSGRNVAIGSGLGAVQGRFFIIPKGSSDTVTIASESSGYSRVTIICAKITVSGDVQSFSWSQVSGTRVPSSQTPPDPVISDRGDLDNNGTFGLLPLIRVVITGSNVTAVGYATDLVFASNIKGMSSSSDARIPSQLPVPITEGGTNATTGGTGLNNLLAANSPMVLGGNSQYGKNFPANPVDGQLFFKEV